MKKIFKCKKAVFPYLVEVLNRSKYDGRELEYGVRITDNTVEITFSRPITGNYFHGRIVEAYESKAMAETGCRIPTLTREVADDPKKRNRILRKYGTHAYTVCE